VIASPEAAAAALRTRSIFFLVALSPRFFLDQRLAVGYRDLVIIGMDFGKRKKTVPVAAIVNQGRLERRFDTHDLGDVNIATKLFLQAASKSTGYREGPPWFLRGEMHR
jgi:hypothetical protein